MTGGGCWRRRTGRGALPGCDRPSRWSPRARAPAPTPRPAGHRAGQGARRDDPVRQPEHPQHSPQPFRLVDAVGIELLLQQLGQLLRHIRPIGEPGEDRRTLGAHGLGEHVVVGARLTRGVAAVSGDLLTHPPRHQPQLAVVAHPHRQNGPDDTAGEHACDFDHAASSIGDDPVAGSAEQDDPAVARRRDPTREADAAQNPAQLIRRQRAGRDDDRTVRVAGGAADLRGGHGNRVHASIMTHVGRTGRGPDSQAPRGEPDELARRPAAAWSTRSSGRPPSER